MCVCLRIDISEVFNSLLIRNMSEFQCISRFNKWQWQGKRSGVTWYKIEVQNKLLFFYTVQSVSKLHKGTLTFWSHFILYRTLFIIPLRTHNIANKKCNWFHLWQVFTFYTVRSRIKTFVYSQPFILRIPVH